MRSIIMRPPRKVSIIPAERGIWRQVAEANANRHGFAIQKQDGDGFTNAYYALKVLPTGTEGIEIFDGEQTFPRIIIPHNGEIWVIGQGVGGGTIVLSFVEWIYSPLRATQQAS